MKRIILAATALILTTGFAHAQGTATNKTAAAKKPAVAAKKVAEKPNLVCAVTGEKIASVAASAGTSVYKGKTYYFCCGGCKPMFDKNPAKYAKTAAAKPAVKKAVTKKA